VVEVPDELQLLLFDLVGYFLQLSFIFFLFKDHIFYAELFPAPKFNIGLLFTQFVYLLLELLESGFWEFVNCFAILLVLLLSLLNQHRVLNESEVGLHLEDETKLACLAV